jgi:hypothetical protein
MSSLNAGDLLVVFMGYLKHYNQAAYSFSSHIGMPLIFCINAKIAV